jgi:predicted O-methyltransferase YrrM
MTPVTGPMFESAREDRRVAGKLRFPVDVPDLAKAAYERAHAGGFGADGPSQSSRPGTGALLAVLAASKRAALIAELGSGLGAGAAWIASGMDERSRLITIEVDEIRAAAARELLAGDARVEVLTGRWEDLLPPHAPFDLIFVDSGFSRQLGDEAAAAFLLDVVRVGGLLVLDDLTPELETASEDPDSKREFAFRNPRVIGAEMYPPSIEGVIGGEQSGLLVMTRIA